MEGGNPFYARFSPDGRRVVYSDNGRDEQSGIWIVDVDGKNGRPVLPVKTKPKAEAVTIGSACWSPDGQRIDVALSTLEEDVTKAAGAVQVVVVVVINLGGGHRSEILHIPDGRGTICPKSATGDDARPRRFWVPPGHSLPRDSHFRWTSSWGADTS
jgi:dipeptidyl aminopeptidase/acylaminoacyl peptidase